MDIDCLEHRRFHADFGADRPHITGGRINRFLHHIAQLARGFHAALARQAQRLNRQQLAPDRSPGESGDNPHLILGLGQTIAKAFHAKVAFQLVEGHFDHLGFCLDDLGHGLAGKFGQLALEVTDAGFAGVGADDFLQRGIVNGKLTLAQGMVLDLLGDQVLLGNLAFFIFSVARKRNDLHPVQQRRRHVVAVRRGQEHDV